MPDAASRLDVVVVVHHGADDGVNENMRRWRQLVGPHVACVVVDNTPQTIPTGLDPVAMVEVDATVVRCPDNPGYLGGVLRAERAVVGDPGAWVIVANADVEPVSVLEATFGDAEADVEVIGPVHGGQSHYHRIGDASILRLLALVGRDGAFWLAGKPASRVAARPTPDGQASDADVMVHGSCFALRRQLLTCLAEVRPRPRLYGEELLIGWMLIRRSRRFVTADNGFCVEHRHSVGCEPRRGRQRYARRIAANLALVFHRLTRFRQLTPPAR